MWLSRSVFLQQRRFLRCAYSTEAPPKIIKVKPSPNTDSKSKKAGTIRALHRENKEMFGDLLESKQEKVSREKKMPKDALGKGPSNRETVFVALKQQSQGPKADPFDLDKSTVVPMDSIDLDSTLDISRNGGKERKITKVYESNWMIKSFSKRTKILSRIPGLPPQGYSSDANYRDASAHFYMKSSKTADSTPIDQPDASSKESREVPTVKQFLASIHQCQDINHYGEVKQIRKDGGKTGGMNSESRHHQSGLITDNKESLIEGSQAMPPEEVITLRGMEISPPKSTSSHDLLPPSSSQDPSNDAKNMISAGYKLFPFDNPKRQTNPDTHLDSPAQILSHPYPQAPHNSAGGATVDPSPKFPSVTRILSATISVQQAKLLKLWEERMIRELGEDGFREYKEAIFRNGKLLHKNLQLLLSGKSIDLEISQSIDGHWKSLEGILGQIQRAQVLESYVTHPELRYNGIVDCVASYRDKLVLIDWKTSEKPKPFISNTYDTPLQIAAYIGALNYDPSYKFKVVEGLAVIAYKDGKACQAFHLSSAQILKYWKLWLQRLKLYHSRESTGSY